VKEEGEFVEEREVVNLLKPHKVSDFPFVRCGAAHLKGHWGSMMQAHGSMFSYRNDCRSHRPGVSRNRPMLPTISRLHRSRISRISLDYNSKGKSETL
jgi:hypothetical protein